MKIFSSPFEVLLLPGTLTPWAWCAKAATIASKSKLFHSFIIKLNLTIDFFRTKKSRFWMRPKYEKIFSCTNKNEKFYEMTLKLLVSNILHFVQHRIK